MQTTAERIETPTDRAGHLIFRFEARLNVLPIGVTPEGLRMANSYEGIATGGDLVGARVRGTDHLLLRRDGVCVIEAQTLISREGEHVYEDVHGYCLPPDGLQVPPLETLMEPDFEWPDIDFPIVGFSTFRAALPHLEYLNNATARIDGWVNFATGGLAVDTRLLAHDAATPRPRRV